jgi:WS/DGAT/MGAT family acyltransferase
MRQLTSLDAQFLAVESARTYGHVGGLAVYDPATAPGGELTAKDICRLVGERLHLLPPFTWKLVNVPFGLDLPYWIEDPDFDLDFHIRESAVPPPGDDRRLGETVARIFARPLDRNRPLWELYLIQGLSEGRVALLTKVHHSVVDGVSGNEILATLLDPSPEGRDVPPPPKARRPERKPGELEMLARGALGLPLQPLRALRNLPSALPHLTDLPGANAIPVVPTLSRALAKVQKRVGADWGDGVLEVTTARAPRTRFNGPVSPHRRFSFGSLSLETIKSVKNALGPVTVNDVVVTLCATAVREWLLERGELPDDPLVAMVPGLRADLGAARDVREPDLDDDRPDPDERRRPARAPPAGQRVAAQRQGAALRAAREHPHRRHQLHPARGRRARGADDDADPRPHAAAAEPGDLQCPGPRDPLYLAGAQLQGHFPVSVVVDGVGLNITVMSYRDHVDFGVIADRDQVDDVWSMIDGLRRALDELHGAICGTGAAPRNGSGDGAAARERARPTAKPAG